MTVEILTEANFELYCAKAYDVRYYTSPEDLKQDLKRIGYIKKLLIRYAEDGDLKTQLILNHIIVLNNVFGAKATSSILFFKLEEMFSFVKPFLTFLSICPEFLFNIKVEGIINIDEIPEDPTIKKALETL